MIKIIHEHIDVNEILQGVQDPSAGGIDIFIGTTRNHSNGKEVVSLEYEAYDAMALKMMNMIEEEVRRRWQIRKISMVHRVGAVAIGEASVVIAVSAAHRKEAFEACRYAIDTLKKNVPIWKKEVFVDGEMWAGTPEN